MICTEARMPGLSVSAVARRYDVNANLVFKWLRDRRFASGGSDGEGPGFLPVAIAEERSRAWPGLGGDNWIEIDLAGGHRLRISGSYDPEMLAKLIRGLSS